ncbi:MAG: hypothetical protein U0575_09875 [Phycisphaerales bacterium]
MRCLFHHPDTSDSCGPAASASGCGATRPRLTLLLSHAAVGGGDWQRQPLTDQLPRLLEPMGIRCVAASCGDEAQEIIKSVTIHIAVVDLAIPLRAPQRTPAAPQPPLVQGRVSTAGRSADGTAPGVGSPADPSHDDRSPAVPSRTDPSQAHPSQAHPSQADPPPADPARRQAGTPSMGINGASSRVGAPAASDPRRSTGAATNGATPTTARPPIAAPTAEAGARILQLLRRLESRPPVIVIRPPQPSLRESGRTLTEALDAGAFAVLDRPIHLEAMLDALRRIVRRHYANHWPG